MAIRTPSARPTAPLTRASGLGITVAAGGLVAVVLAVYLPRIAPLDLHVFVQAGRAVLSGEDAYPTPGTPAAWSGFGFVYPYLTAWLFAPLALLPRGVADDLYAALSVGAVILAVRLSGARGNWPWVLALLSGTTIVGLQIGSLNALLLCGTVLAWRLRDRPVAVGLTVALLVIGKLFLAPLVLWLVATRRWRAAGWAVALTATGLVAGWVVGPLGPVSYLQLVRELGAHEVRQGWSTTRCLLALGASPGLAELLAAGMAVTIVGAGWLITVRRADERVIFAAVVVAALVASPIVWSHYLLLLLAPLLVARARARAMAAYATITWLIVSPHHSAGPAGLLPSAAKLALVQLLLMGTAVYVGHAARRHAARGATSPADPVDTEPAGAPGAALA